MMPDKVKVAAVQASPIFMSKEATIDKACRLIREAGRQGARLIAFPECFISGYPSAWTLGFDSEIVAWEKAHLLVQDSALSIPSIDCDRLCDAAREVNAYVVMGCNELDNRVGSHTLYNTLLFIDSRGKILGKHRKVMPTYTERLYHGLGDGSDLEVYETDVGRLGGLLCYEHHMPLIKAVLMMQGEQIHVAAWPGHWRSGRPGESGNLAGQDINACDITPATREYAVEAQCFVVSANLVLTMDQIPDDFPFKKDMEYVGEGQGDYVSFCCGGSHVVAPSSEFLAGPVFGVETIVYADCDFSLIKLAKVVIDVMGHYQRWDVARLELMREQPWNPFTSRTCELQNGSVLEKLENIAKQVEAINRNIEKDNRYCDRLSEISKIKKRICEE